LTPFRQSQIPASDFAHWLWRGLGLEKSQQEGAAMSFYEKGPVRIHFEEKGSGFPLLMIAGGGLNSAIPNLSGQHFIKENNNERKTKSTT
jgi:hypothetical protein